MANLSLKRNDHVINSQWILRIIFANGAKRTIGCLNREDLIKKAKLAARNSQIVHVKANNFTVK